MRGGPPVGGIRRLGRLRLLHCSESRRIPFQDAALSLFITFLGLSAAERFRAPLIIDAAHEGAKSLMQQNLTMTMVALSAAMMPHPAATRRQEETSAAFGAPRTSA
ncbi:unnamed protein product [Vitrella brassicaformis CCMP3155]|uniref:Uncharacterized protein n=1 Tax=Vitrella brassicaformis (strain CCMP3155) TaxID=1169540 RepID=A0A0G4EQP4_VITBC|nr:unnamed protein product [Vitrella brassicaformis CCMP3155]|eukprot:CEM00548.1 unnamed protein product [Vitrella brassicaformis CCMP3155]